MQIKFYVSFNYLVRLLIIDNSKWRLCLNKNLHSNNDLLNRGIFPYFEIKTFYLKSQRKINTRRRSK